MLPRRTSQYAQAVPDVLIATDSRSVSNDVRSVLGPDMTVREVIRGAHVVPEVHKKTPDLAILDLQIGKMGGMATSLELHLEEGAGRLPHVPVLILLDRRADVFLARRAQAEGWIVKPLDPMRLSRAIRTVLDGGRYEDASYRPPTVALPPNPPVAPAR